MTYYPSDLEIANAAIKKPIQEIAKSINIDEKALIKFGDDKAKLNADLIPRITASPWFNLFEYLFWISSAWANVWPKFNFILNPLSLKSFSVKFNFILQLLFILFVKISLFKDKTLLVFFFKNLD